MAALGFPKIMKGVGIKITLIKIQEKIQLKCIMFIDISINKI